MNPITLNDTRKCPGGHTRVAPKTLRRDCLSCYRLRPRGEEIEVTDVDPAGAWVDATHGREGYCRERAAPNVAIEARP